MRRTVHLNEYSLVKAPVSRLLVNTSGVPRLTKFYSPIRQSAQAIVAKIYSLISTRSPGSCNFLEAPELDDLLGREDDNEKLRVVYRSYATLHFIFVVDTSESELGILDLIQVRDLAETGCVLFRKRCRIGFCRGA